MRVHRAFPLVVALLALIPAAAASADTVRPVSGVVTVVRPGGPVIRVIRATPLRRNETLDTRHGMALVSQPAFSAGPHRGAVYRARVSGGAARFLGSDAGSIFALAGPLDCPASGNDSSPTRSLRLSSRSGSFIVQGAQARSSDADDTSGATDMWTTSDSCGATTVTVHQGEVRVADFATDRLLTLNASQRYVARAADAVYPLRWGAPERIGMGLSGISCPTTSFCVAAELGGGELFVTSDVQGGPHTWHPVKVTPYGLYAVDCPLVSLCIAVADGATIVSTDPTGGPTAWTTQTFSTGSLQSVACSGPTLCLVPSPDGVFVTTSPATNTWTDVQIAGTGGVLFLGCAPATADDPGLCTGLTSTGVTASADPAGGASTWRSTPVDWAGEPACPTSGECVYGAQGAIYVTTNPLGDPPAFRHEREIDVRGLGSMIEGIACPAADRCVAVDDAGDAVSGDPLSDQWSVAGIDRSTGLSSVSCPSVTECVAVDINGRVLLGLAP